MSSSPSEDDGIEFTPDGSPPGRNIKRRANTPSPGMVSRKKRNGKVFPDSGLEMNVSDVWGNADPRGLNGTAVAVVDDDEDEGIWSLGSSGLLEQNETVCGPSSGSFVLDGDIPEGRSSPPLGAVNTVPGTSRSRRRLSTGSNKSIAGDDPSPSFSSEIGVGVDEGEAMTPAEVHNIFETCRELFNANRISPRNAFNLRLLDCINQMINSPGFDKTNMKLASSTVEIGTKIYVCQVDNAHSQVLSLASDITLQQRQHRKRKRDDGVGEADAPRTDIEDEEGRDSRPWSKNRVIRRRGMCVEEDNSKLLTGLEEQNVKFVSRRTSLKRKIDEMILNDIDFDYLSYFLEPEEEHPLYTRAEEANMTSQMVIPETFVNQTGMSRLEFLPFNHLRDYDPDTHDIWGISLNSAETNRAETSVELLVPNDEHTYDPTGRPAQYEVEEEGHNLNDTFSQTQPGSNYNTEGGGGIPAVSFHNIPSLDHLDNYFQRIRNLLNDKKSKYGWCGPKFVLPKTKWAVRPRGARAKKAKHRPKKIDFNSIDWNDIKNKFSPNVTASVIKDERVEAWSTQKLVIPFLGTELDYDLDPMDTEYENDLSIVPTIFQTFLSSSSSILQLPSESHQRPGSPRETSMGPPSLGEDKFGGDNDLEFPSGEDIWQLPGWLPELLHDDPLGAVSGFDSTRFSRKPKPIDMGALKTGILKVLSEKLELDQCGMPVNEGESTIGLAQLMYQVLQQIGPETEKIMSVPIFVAALMHVVAEKTLFVLYDEATDPECPMVVCKGLGWVHADHVTVHESEFEME